MRIRLASFFVATLAAAAVGLVSASTAQADDCGFRCYTKAWQGGVQLAGVQATWDIQDLAAGDWPGGGFALQGLWAITNFAPLEWVEVGYRRGWQGANWTGYFWAESIADWGGYYEYQISQPTPGPLGSPHNFMINYVGDAGNGAHIFRVYIDGLCVQSGSTPCESWHRPWIAEHDVGSEATQAGSIVGPTHLKEMKNRAQGSGSYIDWSPNGLLVSKNAQDQPVGLFEWYGDHKRAAYGQSVQYWDPFAGPNSSDPNWPKTAGYWSESGGDIFIHNVDPQFAHLHTKYNNGAGYLLMRRDKYDGHTGSPIVVEFGYSEDLAAQAGRFFGVWSTSPTDTQMGIGVNTSRCPNTYFYRWGPHPINDWTCDTGVSRGAVVDWHVFRFYIKWPEEGGSYGEIDGRAMGQVNTNLTPDNLSTWGIASAWGLIDQPAGYDGIWDNAVYFHP